MLLAAGAENKIFSEGRSLYTWLPGRSTPRELQKFENSEAAKQAEYNCHLYDLNNHGTLGGYFNSRAEAEEFIAEKFED